MTLTKKDKLALPVAILLGGVFGYFSVRAGFAGAWIGALYGVLIVPLVVLFVADQRKFLVWQASIIPYALWIIAVDARLGAMTWHWALVVFYVFWAAGSLISSPIVIVLYWKRTKGRPRSQVVWLLLGLVFAGVLCSFLRDVFLFFGLSLLWLVANLVKSAWPWRGASESAGSRVATLAASFLLMFTASMAVVAGISFKQQAFRSAMTHDYFRLARLFVRIGADPDGRDRFGQTALVQATWNGVGDPQAVDVLISMGATVNQQQQGALHGLMPSGSALHVAASAGRMGICKSLLQAGADVNAKNQHAATPLSVALSGTALACVPVLLEYGADVNSRDTHGRTPLMLLMTYGPDDPAVLAILDRLLAKGADVDAKDDDGRSFEDWAKYYKHERFRDRVRSAQNSR